MTESSSTKGSDGCSLYRLQAAIDRLAERGYGERERLHRKMSEEVGEYAEAIEYLNGATRKVEKYRELITPCRKLREEAIDLVMMAFAIAKAEGMNVIEACDAVADKLEDRDRG